MLALSSNLLSLTYIVTETSFLFLFNCLSLVDYCLSSLSLRFLFLLLLSFIASSFHLFYYSFTILLIKFHIVRLPFFSSSIFFPVPISSLFVSLLLTVSFIILLDIYSNISSPSFLPRLLASFLSPFLLFRLLLSAFLFLNIHFLLFSTFSTNPAT